MRSRRGNENACSSWATALRDLMAQRDSGTFSEPTSSPCTASGVPIPTILSVSIRASDDTRSPRNVKEPRFEYKLNSSAILSGQHVEMGHVGDGEAVYLTCSSGHVGKLRKSQLMSCWDTGLPRWVACRSPTDVASSIDLQVSINCTVLDTPSSEKTLPSPTSLRRHSLDEMFSLAFIVLCAGLYLFYGVGEIHWLHQCCLTTGFALGLVLLFSSTFTRPISTNTTEGDKTLSLTRQESDIGPRLHFTLQYLDFKKRI